MAEDAYLEMVRNFEQLSPEERIRAILSIGEPGRKKRYTAHSWKSNVN
jgi:hypothetical protein